MVLIFIANYCAKDKAKVQSRLKPLYKILKNKHLLHKKKKKYKILHINFSLCTRYK